MMLSRWSALRAHLSHARVAAGAFSASSSASPPPPPPHPPQPPRSPYEILRVQPSASSADIKAAFRREAMRLHPDVAGEQAAADFLELASAFEALSDPARRRAVDREQEAAAPSSSSSSSPSSSSTPRRSPPQRSQSYESPSYDERDLPPFLQRWFEQERQRRQREREARANVGAAAPWPLNLAERWFVGRENDTAAAGNEQQQGPNKSLDPRSAEAVAGALARCRAALADDLHSALMLAFFGPRAPRRGLPAGHLPPAFEAEERADPRLTPDLLHLVSGRTLLGVVRERRPLMLEGDDRGRAAGAVDSAAAALALPLAFEEGSSSNTLAAEDPRAVLREVLGEDADDDSSSWTAEQEAEVVRRLDAPHALRGKYGWAEDLPPEVLLGGQRGSLLAMPPLPPLLMGGGGATTATTGVAPAATTADAVGAARDRAAWHAAVASKGPRPLWERADNANEDDDDNNPFLRPDAAELALRRARALAAAHASAERARSRRWRRLVAAPTADWVPEEWQFDDASPGVTVLELALTPRGAEEVEGEAGGGSGAQGGVIAVGVRHEDPWALRELGLQQQGDDHERRQRGRFGGLFGGLFGAAKAPLPAHARFPLKIYVGGRFAAAALDDVLMEPHTGDLMAAVYRMSSPGVSHLWFLRPQKPAPRLLARLKRGWLPPSATWLFPPRAPGSHDIGGWYVEAERPPTNTGNGSGQEARLAWPGYIHPAVYLMVAAFSSLDAERRREEQKGQWFGGNKGFVSRLVAPIVQRVGAGVK
jgi:hypothetical protein